VFETINLLHRTDLCLIQFTTKKGCVFETIYLLQRTYLCLIQSTIKKDVCLNQSTYRKEGICVWFNLL